MLARSGLGLGLAAAGLALVAACGSPPGPGGTPPTTGTLPNAPSNPGTAPSAGESVQVTMTDFHLRLSRQSFAPGTYTFVASNAGQTAHALEIDGPGVADKRTEGVVRPGTSANLTVTLSNGSYEVYCPVDGHKGMGMDTTITVGAGGPAPSSTSGSGGGNGGY